MKFNKVEEGRSEGENNVLSFFIDLGREFYNYNTNKKFFSVCISLPQLDFISSLITLGIVDSLYADNNVFKSELENIEYGTIVLYEREKGKPEEIHTFEGIQEGKYPILKTFHKLPTTIVLRKENWRDFIRIAPTQKKYKTNRKVLSKEISNLSKFYSEENIQKLFTQSEVKILIVGTEARFGREIQEKIHNKFTFREWILPKGYGSSQAPYVSQAINYKTNRSEVIINKDTIIIYDGINAYYKSPFRSCENSEIILLERKAPEELIENVLEEIFEFENSSEYEYLSNILKEKIPNNIEIIAWNRGET